MKKVYRPTQYHRDIVVLYYKHVMNRYGYDSLRRHIPKLKSFLWKKESLALLESRIRKAGWKPRHRTEHEKVFLDEFKPKDFEQRSNIMSNLKTPRYLRVYDYGEQQNDRYTAVFTRMMTMKDKSKSYRWAYVGFNGNPTSPNMGFWQHGELDHLPKRGNDPALGKEIPFDSLPEICKQLLSNEY